MRAQLFPHPTSGNGPLTGIDVTVHRAGTKLEFAYAVHGATEDVLWPAGDGGQRADDLWKHTCFEAFIMPGIGPHYYEFNFSPSTAWAAHAFQSYRQGQASVTVAAPEIRVSFRGEPHQQAHGARIDVAIDIAGPPGLIAAVTWQIGLSAVVEEQSGAKQYWALLHPQPNPDFHDATSFARTI